MMKRLAIATIAATFMATMVSLPKLHAQAPLNPQGVLKPEPFADVPPDHWAYNAVESLRQQGLIDGYPDQTFKGKRPMTRYEIAQLVWRMAQGIQARLAALEGTRAVPAAGITEEQLNAQIQQLRDQMLTREQVQQMIDQAVSGIRPSDTGNLVTREQLATVQRLVDEFRNELGRLNVDVDALKRDLADVRTRLEAVEAELARRPRVIGEANLIGKGAWKSDQVVSPISGAFRPVLDRDGRPLTDDTNVLSPVLGYYDLDLGIVARPFSDVRVGGIFNVGNYVSSYDPPRFHDYADEGADQVTPYKVFVNVPFSLFGGDNELTIGRLGSQLTPYTFKAVDPDTYTYLPREDSGEVVFFGAQTAWRFGSAKLRAMVGTEPLDGRLRALNNYNPISGVQGLDNIFGIGTVGNFVGARLAFGEPEVSPFRAAELPVGTAEQENVAPITAAREVAPEVAAPAVTVEEEAVESGVNFGPLRNMVFGLNWLHAAQDDALTTAVADARASVYGADTRFSIGPIKVQAEAAYAESQPGGPARPRALADWAIDARGYWSIPLGSAADLNIGGGYRRIELGYLAPGYWGTIGSWKNPRGIQGPLAEIVVPLRWNIASFLQNLRLVGRGEWYEMETDIAGTAGNEDNLRIDHYLAGVQFGLTSRNTVDLGFEQVFRNYVPTAGAGAFINIPTMGVGGSPIVGTRVKNTETYINFGIGHNFTPDVQAKLLYQIVEFEKFAVDTSNQPANYRGYVATAQVGVRF